MIKSPVILPRAVKGWVSRTSVLGTNSYDLDSLCSPDTICEQSKVFDLASPKFEPNKVTAFDKSRYGNHGTITGATWVTLPGGKKVLSFDGNDDYISSASSASLQTPVDNLTIAVWINAANVTSLKQYTGILTKGALKYGVTRDERVGNNAKVAFYVNSGVGLVATVPLGTWFLYVGTYDKALVGNEVKVYINGAFSVQTNYDTSITHDDGALDIGKYTTVYFNGKIALLRIYNITFSSGNIYDLYNRERHLFGV